MAHIFKPTVVKPVPKNAVVKTIKGVRYAVWTNRRHRPVQAELTPDGAKCRVPGPTWWVEYTKSDGHRGRAKGFPSREATNHLATDLERQANDVRAGHTSVRHDSPAHMIDHLPDFRESLEVRDRGAGHIASVIHNVRAVLTEVRLTTPGSVDCDAVMRWLAGERRRQQWSAENLNRYILFLRQFGKWLVKAKRAKHNPFDDLERVEAGGKKTKSRRRLSEDELARLITAAFNSPVKIRKLTGPERAYLYLLASFTGLRIGTLAKLTPEAFTWHAGLPASVTAAGRHTKNRKTHTVPLHPDVAKQLAPWLRDRSKGQPLFVRGEWSRRGFYLVERDLTAARAAWLAEAKGEKERTAREASDFLKYINAAGDVFDFHAHRVQFISGLALAKVPLTAAQQLADHSTPTLTANIYTKWGPAELASEVAKLPAVPGLGSRLGSELGSRGGICRQSEHGGKGKKKKTTATHPGIAAVS
jgi:integrase/recombinase XerC